VNKKIVLLDMDGTLTEPRQKLDSKDLQASLYTLYNSGIHVGIITGSDEDYLRQQMGEYLHKSPTRYKTHLLPCNGTKYLSPPEFATQDFNLKHSVSMEDKLGKENYRELICELVCSQLDVCQLGAPLTGHFINCRGSMINWSPIGRNASKEKRREFIEIEELRAMLSLKDLDSQVTIKFGGDTSFDIYPTGWDKTYGLSHFKGWDTWFIGDRCGPDGNDYEIYNACLGQSYTTDGPEKTQEIIECILKNIKGV
jgi:phosphomannomutase